MSEDSERTAARDVLQSSELTARLLRRADVSPGVLDTTTLRQVLARLARWVERPVTLFDELMFRYRVDDDSVDADDQLVMEQHWMANVNAYLTNSNSFSSTINQFIEGVAASRPGTAAGTPTSSGFEKSGESHSSSVTARTGRAGLPPPPAFPSTTPSGGSSGHVPNHDAQTPPPRGAATHSPVTKFRVSRSPARRARDDAASDASDVARSPALQSAESAGALPSTASEGARAEGEEDRPAKTTPEKVGLTRVIRSEHPRANAPAAAPPTALPLARAQITQPEIQRKSADEGGGVSRRVSKADTTEEGRRPAQVEEPPTAAGAPPGRGPASPARDVEQISGVSKEELRLRGDGPGTDAPPQPDTTPPPVSAQAGTPGESPHGTLPLVQRRIDPSQARRQPPDFVWRKGADPPAVTNPTASDAGGNPLRAANQAAGHTPTFPSPHSQTITGEAAGRKDEPRAGPEVTTERVLRNLSRRLLVERERRGY